VDERCAARPHARDLLVVEPHAVHADHPRPEHAEAVEVADGRGAVLPERPLALVAPLGDVDVERRPLRLRDLPARPVEEFQYCGYVRRIAKHYQATTTGQQVIAIEGDSAFGFSGMEVETICRYNLPVCVVIFNNDGIYRGTDVNPTGGSDVAPTVFVKGSRYDRMMDAFGGIGVNATTPDELKRAVNAAMDSGKPTLINAVIDPASGSESGRIGNLNPQSILKKK